MDVLELKRQATGRWPEIISRLGGIDERLLDGRHHECPQCGGRDRFRMIDEAEGACLCNQCLSGKCGDGLAVLQWATGCSFPEAKQMVADYLGTAPAPTNGRAKTAKPDRKGPADLLAKIEIVNDPAALAEAIEQWCKAKPGIKPQGVTPFGPQLCWWPRQGRGRYRCLAFYGRDTREPEAIASIKLFRVDGQPFPATEKLAGRKTHTVGGSRNGWLWAGTIDELRSATTIVKAEGEPDCFSLQSQELPDGWAVVTNTNGCGAVGRIDFSFMAGKRVPIIPDSDTPGIEGGAKFAAKAIEAGATSAPLVLLPGEVSETHGADLRDFFAAGHTIDELRSLMNAARQLSESESSEDGELSDSESSHTGQPEYDEAEAFSDDGDEVSSGDTCQVDESSTPEDAPKESWAQKQAKIEAAIRKAGRVINALVVLKPKGDSQEEEIWPLTMPRVVDNIFRLTHNWPRRVGPALFVHDGGDAVHSLESESSLFGWLADRTKRCVEWRRVIGCVTKPEVYEQLRRAAICYEAVERLPHFPAIEAHYYAHGRITPGDGRTLDALVDRFSPETPTDRDLIKAAFCTPFWGGAGGARPAFLWTAPAGRGMGKSTAAKFVGEVAGGFLDVEQGEDMATFKQRLLSADGRTRRVVRVDNVKSRQFGWAELEAMITAPRISGKQLYVGEGQRPNTLTWQITLNGASLSTDMAQRCVEVRLGRPKHDGDWEDQTREFVVANHAAIVADIAAFFTDKPQVLHKFTRWGAWERSVLARLPDPTEAQLVIAERQGEADVEREDAEIIEDHFAKQLRELEYDVDTHRVFIPSGIVAKWYAEATGDKRSTTITVSRHICQLINEKRLLRLYRNQCNTYGKGFLWAGHDCDPEAATRLDLESRIGLTNR